MSRLYTRNARGRQPMLGAPSTPKTKEHPNDTYQPRNGKKHQATRKYAAASKVAGKRKRAATPSDDDSSSTLSSETAGDASDEESEEADDEDEDVDDHPAVPAPSRTRASHGTGRKFPPLREDVSIAGSLDSMFGDYEDYYEEDDDPRLSPEENRKRFETEVFADSDDDNVYQAVEDISDSEDDWDDRRVEEQELLAMLSDEENSDADFLLNQIDGLSAYGFGDESDGSVQRFPSSQPSDGEGEPARRVHFAVGSDRNPFLRMSESPTITRALLPSAMPDMGLLDFAVKGRVGGSDDLDDSDLTDDCLPEGAHYSTPANAHERDPSPSVTPPGKKTPKKSARRRGPPRGIFIDEGDKPSGILDPSGKIILMTNPHLLGEEFARRYGASQTSSPDVGFAELIDESDNGDREGAELIGGPNADIMLASFNSVFNDPANLGDVVGPLEAFYPANSFVLGDYAIDPDELEENFQPLDDLGEDVIQMKDVIQFDEDGDDSDAPTSPIFMPPNHELSGIGNVNNEFAHLNNSNVTAFRRNADPKYAALSNTPSFHNMDLFSSPFATPTPRRKRKHHSSPYTSSHYKGVTPVQRMRDPNHGQIPETSSPAKRRRLMT